MQKTSQKSKYLQIYSLFLTAKTAILPWDFEKTLGLVVDLKLENIAKCNQKIDGNMLHNAATLLDKFDLKKRKSGGLFVKMQ